MQTVIRWMSPEGVQLGDYEAPRDFHVLLMHSEWPMEACTLAVTVDPDRGPIAAGLGNARLGRWAGTTDVPNYLELHSILTATTDLHSLLRTATALAVAERARDGAFELLTHADGEGWTPEELSMESLALAEGRDEVARRAFEAAAPQRRRLVTRQHLRDVAAVYRDALASGLPPTKHVSEHFHASHSTAARWVGLARTAGELRPATGTKPGEEAEQ